jgi:hypothetical protein
LRNEGGLLFFFLSCEDVGLIFIQIELLSFCDKLIDKTFVAHELGATFPLEQRLFIWQLVQFLLVAGVLPEPVAFHE